MTNKVYNVIYIGCGPANIFSVLTHPQNNSLMIEQGQSIKNRTRKEVLFGFGGSGCFSDSKLIGSNGRTSNVNKNITFSKYADKILQWYNYFSDDKLDWKQPDSYEIPSDRLYLIKSRVCHYGTDRSKIVFSRVENFIQKNICRIRFEEKVISITKGLHRFIITTNKSSYQTKQVVVGTGTRDNLVKNLILDFNLPKVSNLFQIGVRVEISNIYMIDILSRFYDFKIAMNTPKGYWRTFCVNSGAAYVVVERGTNYVSANGHSYANKSNTGLINFGLIGALDLKYTKEQQIKWAQRINNCTNKLLVQDIDDFLSAKTTKKIGNTTVSSKDYRTGNLWDYIEPICYELKTYIMELRKHLIFKGHFFAPEINLTNPILKMNSHFEIYPNLYLVGDAGVTRSIVDAGVSGIIAGENL